MRSQSEKAMTLSERLPSEKAMTLSEKLPPGPNDNEVAVREGNDVVREIATRAQRQ